MKVVIRFKSGEIVPENSVYLYSQTETVNSGYSHDIMADVEVDVEWHYYEISDPE